MDKTTKQILELIKHKQVIQFSGIENPFDDIAPEVVVNASLEYLVKHNYIHITEGLVNEIALSYRSFHPFRHYLKNLLFYLLNNWIAIVALIISIIALLKQ